MTGGSGKEHRTNNPPPTGRVQERAKGHRGQEEKATTEDEMAGWHH